MKNIKKLAVLLLLLIVQPAFAGGGGEPAYEKGQYGLTHDQYSHVKKPLAEYDSQLNPDGEINLWQTLKYRASQNNWFNLTALIIFLCAITHTFMAGYFQNMAHHHQHKQKEKNEKEGRTGAAKPEEDAEDDQSFRAHLFHFLGEVEAIFGIWVSALVGAIITCFGLIPHGIAGFGIGFTEAKLYIAKDVNYIEPFFVFIIMAIAGTRPVVRAAEKVVGIIANKLGGSTAAWWFSIITVTPLLGSFITEPAAMTIAALLLYKKFFKQNPSEAFKYATLGLLFVDVSVGGTLTHFAAPPVLMIAETWRFDMSFMFTNYGWKAIIGVLTANLIYFFIFRKEFANLKLSESKKSPNSRWEDREDSIPFQVTMVHLGALAWTVLFAHYPPLFIGGFLFFMGFTQATGHHQNKVQLKAPLLVGFFLSGLVIHGGCQGWWIAPLLIAFQDSEVVLMIGSTVLTAFNDNAAITYLASQAVGLSIGAKYSILAGAVTGGGITVIANAPNPAGMAILKPSFKDGNVSPLKLAIGAAIPTIIMGSYFMVLETDGMQKDPKPPAKVEKVSELKAH